MVKKKLMLILILGVVSLLGILVGLCGIGLSLGMRKLSLVSFFGTIGLFVVLRLSVYLWNGTNGMNSKS